MKKYTEYLCAALLALGSGTVFATEGGADSFAAGAEGIMAGALPPPGVYFLGYYQNYHAKDLMDDKGNTVPIDFDLKVSAFVPRVVWMSEQTFWGGQLGAYGILPLVDLKVSAAGSQDDRSGVGDLIVGPMLGWHQDNHHWVAAMEFVLPTGSYDENRLANLGKNYTTFRPILGYSYSDAMWDLSTKMAYSINSKNDDTNYKSGQYFSADYSLGYKVMPAVTVALQGNLFKQISDDKADHLVGGNLGQSLSVGPAIHYQKKGWSLEGKYLKETQVENRPKGDSAWLKLVWAF